MIKVIMGYKLRQGVDIAPLLLKLRSYAMTYPGFVNAENLLSEKDGSVAAMVSTWEEDEDWRLWETSRVSREIVREAETLLEEEPKVTTYRIMPTVRWMG